MVLLLAARFCFEQHVINRVPPYLSIQSVVVPRELDTFEKRLHVSAESSARLRSASRSPNAKSGSWDQKTLLRVLTSSNGMESAVNDVRIYVDFSWT